MNFRAVSIAIGLLVAGAVVGPATASAQCRDPWIAQAYAEATRTVGSPNSRGVRLVTSGAISDSGTSGKCNPDYWAKKDATYGHWSSYQDLVNKMRMKERGVGTAYVFVKPENVIYLGHVGWAYQGSDGRYVAGSTENPSAKYDVPKGGDTGFWWGAYNTEQNMFDDMKRRGYSIYKALPVNHANVTAATNAADGTKRGGYSGLGNNCLDHAYTILQAYGVSTDRNVMPWKQGDTAIPNRWFDKFNGNDRIVAGQRIP